MVVVEEEERVTGSCVIMTSLLERVKGEKLLVLSHNFTLKIALGEGRGQVR